MPVAMTMNLSAVYSNRSIKIPIYQRRYSWSEEIADDLLRTFQNNTQQPLFLGQLVWVHFGFQEMVVDGQQRLTTTAILMAVIRHRLLSHPDQTSVAHALTSLTACLINPMNTPHLTLKEDDSSVFSSIVCHGIIPVENRSPKLSAVFNIFRERLANTPIEELMEILQNVFNSTVVVTQLFVNERPGLIFESMNSKGQELTKIDLITNLIFMELNDHAQINLYQNFWSRVERGLSDELSANAFLKSFLAINLCRIDLPSKDLYKIFKHDYFLIKGANTTILEISKFYDAYQAVKNPNHVSGEINEIGVGGQACAILVYFQILYNDEVISLEEMNAGVKIIESYVARRSLLKLSSQSLFAKFTHLAIKIMRDIEQHNFLLIIQSYFAELIGNSRFPSDTEILHGLVTQNFYDSNNKLYFFNRIIGHCYPHYAQTPLNPTIEHIMPQTLCDAWPTDEFTELHNEKLHVIGNLVPVPLNLNSALGQSAFERKRTIFQNGTGPHPAPPYQEIFEVVYSYESWGGTAIDANSKFYAEKLIRIFQPLPPVTTMVPDHVNVLSQEIAINLIRQVFIGYETRIRNAVAIINLLDNLGTNYLIYSPGANKIRMSVDGEDFILLKTTYGNQNLRIFMSVPSVRLYEILSPIVNNLNAEADAIWTETPNDQLIGSLSVRLTPTTVDSIIDLLEIYLPVFFDGI